MTTDVTVQTAYVVLRQPGAAVSGQTAYVVMRPGQRLTVSSQTAYAVIRPGPPPPTGRRRRIGAVISG